MNFFMSPFVFGPPPISMLPLILVSGFLGSGKTTLLRRLIFDAGKRGLKLAVIVNEFGAAEVDGAILRGGNIAQDAEIIAAVAGGCACCAGQDEFVETLLELALRRGEKRPDAVLVEFSGLADPILVLETLAGPELLNLVRPAVLVGVADVGRWDDIAGQMGPLLRRQIALSDLLVLNKTDLAAPAMVEAIASKLRDLNPRAILLPAVEGEIPAQLVWEKLAAPSQRFVAPQNEEIAPHANAHTIVCPLPHPVERAGLERALAALPSDVWRAKGFVRLRGEGGWWLVQFTGGENRPGRSHFAPFHPAWGGSEPATALVFIGATLDEAKLKRDFGLLSAF